MSGPTYRVAVQQSPQVRVALAGGVALTTQAAFMALLTSIAETSGMPSKFFAQETDTLANGATWRGVWHDSGVAPGVLTAIGAFKAQITSDQAVTAFVEYGDDGSSARGASEPTNIAADVGSQEIVATLSARYCRPVVQNSSGSTAHITVDPSFGK